MRKMTCGMRGLIRHHSLWLMVAATAMLLPARLCAQLSITKIGESLVSNSCSGNELNLRSHQDDAIVSFNGYQYCVFYSVIGSDTSRRYVTIGRRALPAGSWETILFTDYTQTINDSHNIISLGICEGDGTIHLAFDHHNVDLNYRISVQGLATNPQAHNWVASKFNAVQDNLPGQDKGRTTGLTYPRFFPKPNGDLQFVRRKGSAIAGKNMIYTYSQTTHQWSHHGAYVDGTIDLYDNDAGETTKLNPYLHGIGYDDNERLHASWVWRTTDGNNFDFMYAYSDDYGINWKNNDGASAGRANSDPITLSSSPPVKIFDFGEGSMLNQTGQAVDSVGRVHVVQKNGAKFRHIYRDTNGNWHHNRIESIAANRDKITTDQHNNVYLITDSAKVYGATPQNNFSDWALVYDGDSGRFGGDAMFDESRMKREGILSILATKNNSKEIYSIDLSVSPIAQPAPTYGNGGTPGSGDPWSINRSSTTRIEAENYDQGDAGTVYSDTTPGNTGGKYRSNDVDIATTSDSGGGHNVGWTKPGEWLQYTVDVAQAGPYDFTFRYSRLATEISTLRISANGTIISGDIDAPGTGDWGIYDTVTTTLELEAGLQTLRLHFVDGSINVNWLEVSPTVAPVITMVALGSLKSETDGSTWSDGLPVHSGADYLVPATGDLRSATGNGTFPGWSLTVLPGGKYQVRAIEASGDVTTVDNLILSGGTSFSPGEFAELSAGTGSNLTNVLDGIMTNSGHTRILTFENASGNPLNRNFKIHSQINGTGRLQAWEGQGGQGGATLTITNTSNSFSGTWETGTGSTLVFENAGAVGEAAIEVLSGAKLRIEDNWTTEASLTVADTSNTQVDFGNYIWSVSDLVFGASAIADGVYSAAELNAMGSHTVFVGSGALRVGIGGSIEPVARWKFNEGTGTLASDSSGNGYHGTILNGAIWGNDATRSSYLSFDGMDGRVETLFQTNLTSIYKDFTWAVWVNNQAPADNGVILGNRYPQIDSNNNFCKLTTSKVDSVLGGSGQNIDFDPDIPQNGWHHHAVVKSGSTLTYYRDGGFVDSREITTVADGTFPFYIGGDPVGSSSEHFQGFIDDVVLYDRALSPSEVAGVMNAPDTTRQEDWRLLHFSTSANSGSAADDFDANFDGESNLLEFATNQNPHAATLTSTLATVNGANIEFRYTRSKAAMADGMSFEVNWSDTLEPDSWSISGVTESVESENSEEEHVVAKVPMGASGARFMHLEASP
jgi:hypothetical protein